MKAEAGVSFHNKFLIERINAKTGEILQTGYGENLILDRGFDQVCAFAPYFTYIHYGEGDDDLSAARTTLFEPVGYKTATIVSSENAYPVSSVTKMIELGTQDAANGKTLTEVGISESISAINTHAMIRDANGKLLSIPKTQDDIIRIYATVFAEFEHPSDNLKFVFPDNAITKYFIDHTVPSLNVMAGKISEDVDVGFITFGEKSGARTNGDKTSRYNKLKARFLVVEANTDITHLMARNMLTLSLPEVGVFEGHNIQNQIVGTGTGSQTDFKTKISHLATDIEVYVDGNIIDESNYSFAFLNTRGDFVPNEIVSPTGGHVNFFDDNLETTSAIPSSSLYFSTNEEVGALHFYAKQGSASNVLFDIGYSKDGADYDTMRLNALANFSRVTIVLPYPAKYFYVKGPYSYSNVIIGEIKFGLDFSSVLKLNNPPGDDELVEVSYKTPYMPKDDKHETEVEFVINFAEAAE